MFGINAYSIKMEDFMEMARKLVNMVVFDKF